MKLFLLSRNGWCDDVNWLKIIAGTSILERAGLLCHCTSAVVLDFPLTFSLSIQVAVGCVSCWECMFGVYPAVIWKPLHAEIRTGAGK